MREVITTGSVDVTVKDPRDVAERFTAWVESKSGRVDGRTESKDDEGRASASLTVRVPSNQMSKALAQLATYGDVGTVDVQNQDVTAQGQDLDARIKALEISIDRLEKILADAGDSAEVVRAETALTQRQEQLESLQAQRKALTDQVSLSTLHVELIQKGSASSVSPGGFQGGLTKGWDALVDTVNGIVSLAGVLIPWLAVALVVLGPVASRSPRQPRLSWATASRGEPRCTGPWPGMIASASTSAITSSEAFMASRSWWKKPISSCGPVVELSAWPVTRASPVSSTRAPGTR